jgi:hypothetical protein
MNGNVIRGIRLKGGCPNVLPGGNGEIAPYTGKGYDDIEITVLPNGVINIRQQKGAPLPEGTITEPRLVGEVKTAELLGPTMTHYLLGYGIYQGLSFNGKEVGLAVYGLEYPVDQRLCYVLKEAGARRDLRRLSWKAGAMLRMLHDEYKLFHQYPHSGNYSLISNIDIRIVDLDMATVMHGFSPRARVAMRYLDLARSLRDFYLDVPEQERVPMIASFVKGYFQINSALDIYKYAEDCIDGTKNAASRNAFGRPVRLFIKDSGLKVESGRDCITDPLFEFFGPLTELPVSFNVFEDLRERGRICGMFLEAFKQLEGIV